MNRTDILVAVIDGQGGGMGRALVEAVKKSAPDVHVRALGTNALATAAMLKAGADDGATGETSNGPMWCWGRWEHWRRTAFWER